MEIPAMICLRSRTAKRSAEIWSDGKEILDEIAKYELAQADAHRSKTRKTIAGYSITAQKPVDFRLASAPGTSINWREDLICPETELNNRVRAAAFHLITSCGLVPSSNIYVTEQSTALYRWMKRHYSLTVGSEWLGSGMIPGNKVGDLRHEDLTALSFTDQSFDVVASFDCLEHIPDYRTALNELARILRPGGAALLTAPFLGGDRTKIRARVLPNGNIEHLEAPEYHGDPVGGGKGILCYYHFGHDILEDMRSAGFAEAEVIWFWSAAMGNIGGLQPYFFGTKPPQRNAAE